MLRRRSQGHLASYLLLLLFITILLLLLFIHHFGQVLFYDFREGGFILFAVFFAVSVFACFLIIIVVVVIVIFFIVIIILIVINILICVFFAFFQRFPQSSAKNFRDHGLSFELNLLDLFFFDRASKLQQNFFILFVFLHYFYRFYVIVAGVYFDLNSLEI